MALFGDLSYAKPSNVYAGSPVEEVKALNASASAEYNKVRDAKDELDVLYNNIDVEDRNISIKQRAIDDLRNKFKTLVTNGDYQNAKYVVKQAQKDYLADRELQDAIASRAKEKTYFSSLQEKLQKGLSGEKGGITEDQYNYAVINSKLRNQNPIQYDPERMKSDNIFQGINISDDLSQEIADQTFKRITDWKANGSTTVDGKTYQIQNIGGVEKVMLNGKEVSYAEVANALKQDVLNDSSFKRYLDENREIEKFNRTFNNETKTQRPLDRTKDLPMLSDSELKEMYLGLDDNKIAELRKSKDIVDQATLQEIEDKEKNFDLNDSKIVEQLYDTYKAKDQLNNIVYPAAEKASFKDYEQKIFTDQAALENLKLDKAKKLKAYEKQLENENLPPVMKSLSQVNQFTGDDYAKKIGNIKTLQDEATKQKALLQNTDPSSSLYRTRVDDYNNAIAQLNIANSEIKNFYSALPEEAKSKLVTKVSDMFDTYDNVRTNRDTKISTEGLVSLINQAKVNKDLRTEAELRTALAYMGEGKQLPPEFVANLSSKIVGNESYLKIASEEDDRISQRSYIIPGEESGFPSNQEVSDFEMGVSGVNNALRTVLGAVVPFYGSRTTINNVITDAYNSKSLDQSLNLVSIPSLDGFEDKKNIPALTKQYYSYAKNVLANSSDLYTTDGTPLDAILAGRSDKKFYEINNDGKYVESLPDLDRTQTALAIGAKDGVKRISNTYYSKDGKPLIISDGEPNSDKGNRTGILLAARDPETFTPLYNIVANYQGQSGNSQEETALKGEVNFGSIFNKVRLGNNVDPFEVSFPNGNSRVIGLKKESDDASTIIDMTPYINGLPNPNYQRPLFGDENSTFRSNEQLLKAFQMSMQ